MSRREVLISRAGWWAAMIALAAMSAAVTWLVRMAEQSGK